MAGTLITSGYGRADVRPAAACADGGAGADVRRAGADPARSRGAGSRLAAVVLVLRPGADRRDAGLASGDVERRAVPGAHGRAPRDRGPRGALARARPDGPAAAADPARPRARVAALARAPGRRLDRVGGQFLRLAPAGALPGRGLQRLRARVAAPDVRRLRDGDVVGAARAAAQAVLVRERRAAGLHHPRAADRDRARQRAAVVGDRVLS